VIKIVELERDRSVQRELLLLKIRVDARQRAEVLQVVDLFRAHVVDVSPEALIVEAIGTPEKLEALMSALSPYDLREIVQSGTVAIGRGNRSITERALERGSSQGAND
jgi:acetolactate synthase-1/3 small subunit